MTVQELERLMPQVEALAKKFSRCEPWASELEDPDICTATVEFAIECEALSRIAKIDINDAFELMEQFNEQLEDEEAETIDWEALQREADRLDREEEEERQQEWENDRKWIAYYQSLPR